MRLSWSDLCWMICRCFDVATLLQPVAAPEGEPDELSVDMDMIIQTSTISEILEECNGSESVSFPKA
jgi:hypothetical protein